MSDQDKDYAQTCTTDSEDQDRVDLDSILKAMENMPEETFAKLMREKGCPHTKGWRLLLPVAMYDMYKDVLLPNYVTFNSVVPVPTLVNTGKLERSHGIQKIKP